MADNNRFAEIFAKRKTENAKDNETVIIGDITRFDVIESYKEIRTNVMFSLAGEGAKIICMTSTSPDDGKTTTCINLAITIAQTGINVLIIDGDLRKPEIHKILKLSTEPGLTNALRGFCELNDAIQKTPYKNLDVLVSGHIPPNPVELLSSDEMAKLLETVKKSYDYIFIDVPPINSVTDVAVLSNLVSGIILIVRHCVTTFDDISSAIEKLKLVNGKILGFIMNDVNERINHKGYYKRSYYAYRSDTDD